MDLPVDQTRPPAYDCAEAKPMLCFATIVGRLGASDRLVKAYMGHSAGDILGGHYRRIELNELRSISDLMKGWRNTEKAGAARKDSGNISQPQIANG